jgi:hypothetical protein
MATEYYIAFNGYGYFNEGINPELSRHALISSNNVYTPEGTSISIPFYTEDDIEIVYTKDGSQVTEDLASYWNNDSAKAVKYIDFVPNANNSPYDIKVYNNGQSTLLKTITLTPVCEPKYSSIKCQFVNRYGVIQTMYFFKKSKESMETEDESYRRNIVSTSSLSYDTKKAQIQRFNVNSRTSVVLSTGFVAEDFNQTIEELFLSENVWITWDSNDTQVIPKTKNLDYKTGLNDKLIDYIIDFEFASSKINNVR